MTPVAVTEDRLGRIAAGTRLRRWARRQFQEEGICVLPGFLAPGVVKTLRGELEMLIDDAFWSTTHSTVYLRPGNLRYPAEHPRRKVWPTRMGTLAQDQLGAGSALRRLHGSPDFRDFVGAVVGAGTLHEYADGLTSVNVLIFRQGDQLGWHFDESEYAITLLLKSASVGGRFEYAPRLRGSGRDSDGAIASLLAGQRGICALDDLEPGALVLFRGDQSLHRVTPVEGGAPRMVAVLSYDNRPGVRLSEHDRLLLYGRIR